MKDVEPKGEKLLTATLWFASFVLVCALFGSDWWSA